jgi:hypothetical protein
MIRQSTKLKQLNKTLFWDINLKSLHYQKNADFIIERVLSFGNEKDYRLLCQIYSQEKIKRAAVKLNYPDKKTVNFWSIIFHIPLNSFLCIKKLSTLRPNAFWQR